jgi:hypothetical protein
MEEQYVKYLKALLNDKFEKVNVKKLDWLYIFEYGDKVAIKHCKVKKETIELCLETGKLPLTIKNALK